MELLVDRVTDKLGADAVQAGITYKVKREREIAYKFEFYGYSNTLCAFVEAFFEILGASIKDGFEKETIEVRKEICEREETNSQVELDLQLEENFFTTVRGGTHFLNNILTFYKDNFSEDIFLDWLKRKAFGRADGSGIFIRTLIFGNLSSEQALDTHHKIIEEFEKQEILLSKNPPSYGELYLFKEHCEPFRWEAESRDKENENHRVMIVLQATSGFDKSLKERMRDSAMNSLLSHILSEKFFNAIRTQQQLGYSADAYSRSVAEVNYLVFEVESCDYEPEEIEKRMEDWLKSGRMQECRQELKLDLETSQNH